MLTKSARFFMNPVWIFCTVLVCQVFYEPCLDLLYCAYSD